MADFVLTTDHDHVRVLALNRPAQRNAMDTALLAELLDALSDAVAEPGVRVVVLTGSGGAFSGGADLREPLDHAATVRRMELFSMVYEAIGTCPKPTVAAIEGACVGGGAEVAAACDIRVGDGTTRVRFPGAALGIPIGASKLVGLVGLGAAKDLVFTSRTVDAAEAYRLGYLQRLVEDGTALAAALQVAADIAGNHQEAVAQLKRHFASFSGLGDRIVAENDAIHALAEAGGDYGALTMPKPGVGAWAGGAWEK
jgi:enoyl-CoA hydratase/carnithine racemase